MNITGTDIPRLCINGTEIDRVTTFNLLGVIISSDLSWDSQVTYILHKVAKRMYCINYLVRRPAITKYNHQQPVQMLLRSLFIHTSQRRLAAASGRHSVVGRRRPVPCHRPGLDVTPWTGVGGVGPAPPGECRLLTEEPAAPGVGDVPDLLL